jgi:RND family efflux transporter MFP subunit
MRKYLVYAVIAVVAVVGIFAYRSYTAAQQRPPAAQQAAAPPVTVARPLVREIVEQDEFTGRFDAVEAVELRARVGGHLESVNFRDGAMVREGDLLFVIDKRPFQVAVNQAQAAIAAQQTRLEFARLDYERSDRLARTGVTDQRTNDERRANFLQAQADLNALRAALDQARLNLEFAEVKAPIAGRISRRLVTEGNLIVADQTLLTTIVTLDPIYLYFDIDERSYLAYMRIAQADAAQGDPARAVQAGTAQAGGTPAQRAQLAVRIALTGQQEFTINGRIDFIDNRLDPSTGTMRMRAIVDNTNMALTPGLFGRVRIPGSDPYRGVLIPDEAIGADQDRRFVYVVAADGTVSQRAIRPGPRQDGYRVVRQGLTGEETIVIAGIQRIRPGATVRPQMTELPATRS